MTWQGYAPTKIYCKFGVVESVIKTKRGKHLEGLHNQFVSEMSLSSET